MTSTRSSPSLALLRLIKRPALQIAVTTLIFSAMLLIFDGNFKFATAAAALVTGVYFVITKNLFVSLFFTYLASMPFLAPAKQYEFEYAAPSEYMFPQWPDGIISSINLSVSNLMEIFLILYLLVTGAGRIIQGLPPISDSFARIFQKPLVKFTTWCWLGYLSISFYSSLFYSMFPNYSMYLLFENSKLLVSFLGTMLLLRARTKSAKLFHVVLIAMLLFQATTGGLQFMTNLGSNNSLYTQDAEENIPYARVSGVSYHANIHAFIVLLLFILVLPSLNQYAGWISALVIALSGINIILSQSRTAWVSIAAVIGYIALLFKRQAINHVQTFVKEKRFYRFIIVGAMAFLIMLPRLQASTLFFGEEGGGALRAQMISEGIQLLPDMPLAGYGLGTGEKVFLTKFSKSYATTYPLPIHFAYLQMALESGIIGALLFYMPIFMFFVYYSRQHKGLNEYRSAVLFCALCAILTVFVHFVFQPAYGQIEFYLIGIALGTGILSLLQATRKKEL